MEWLADLASGVLATLIGVGLGIPAGFWLERGVTAHRRKEERAEVLHALQKTVTKNRGLLDQLSQELAQGMVFYGLDLPPLESLANRAREVCGPVIADAIDELRYEMSHFQRKLDQAFQNFGTGQVTPPAYAWLLSSCRTHLASLIPLSQRVEKQLQEEARLLIPKKH